MDVVHTLCVPFYMGRWTLSRNAVFCIEDKKVDRTQEHLLHWTRLGRQNTETLHTSLNVREWAESRNLWFFTEQNTVDRTPKICAFFQQEMVDRVQKLYLLNMGMSAESRNLIFCNELETVDRVQKLPLLYSTRTVDQSEETLTPLLNTRRWSESRN